jgi:hypothetical protein
VFEFFDRGSQAELAARGSSVTSTLRINYDRAHGIYSIGYTINDTDADIARLLRDASDPRHFVSLAHWRDAEVRDMWMTHPDFQDRIGTCMKLCDEVHASPYEQVVSV